MFNKRLKQLREEKNLYQQDLAEVISVSKSTVAMWETGRRDPGSDMLLKIAKYFGVTVDYLLGKTNFKNGIENYSSFCNTVDPFFDDSFDFGPLCKSERENQGITISEMSAKLGLTESDLEDIEDGVLPINEDWARKIVDYLGTSISQILFNNDLYNGDVPEEYRDRVDEWEAILEQNDKEAKEDSFRNSKERQQNAEKIQIHHNKDLASDENLKFALFEGADNITDEMFDKVKAFAKFVQQEEAKKNDNK